MTPRRWQAGKGVWQAACMACGTGARVQNPNAICCMAVKQRFMAAETSAKTDAAAAAEEAAATSQVGQVLQLPNRKSTCFCMCVCVYKACVCACEDSFKCLATYLNMLC